MSKHNSYNYIYQLAHRHRPNWLLCQILSTAARHHHAPPQMAATSPCFSPNRTLSFSTASHNHNQRISLQSLRCFPASASSVSSLSRSDCNSRILTPRLKASATPAAPVMDEPTSSSSSSSTAVPAVVEVDLGNRSYPIYIGSGLLNQPELLQR